MTMPNLPWDGPPVCLVTGAARGLGIEVAAGLARLGATVLIASRDPAAASAAAAERADDGDIWAVPRALDISEPTHVSAAAADVADKFGRLDVLINNAAAYVDWAETASAADLDRSRAVMNTNLYGSWAMIQAFLPLLRHS